MDAGALSALGHTPENYAKPAASGQSLETGQPDPAAGQAEPVAVPGGVEPPKQPPVRSDLNKPPLAVKPRLESVNASVAAAVTTVQTPALEAGQPAAAQHKVSVFAGHFLIPYTTNDCMISGVNFY